MNGSIETAADLSPQACHHPGGCTRLDAKRWWRPWWWGWFLIGVVIVAIAAGAFIEVEHARLVELGNPSPAQDARFASNSVTVRAPSRGTCRPEEALPLISIDGGSVNLLGVAGLFSAWFSSRPRFSLVDGTLTASLEYTSANIFSPQRLRVDYFQRQRHAPVITL